MLSVKSKLLAVFLMITSPVFAQQIVPLSDPLLEERAQQLALEIRCLVCQNQSIASSDADLAVDLKILIRELILDGNSDEAVKIYLVERYGEFVLLKPLFNQQTSFLWLTPIIFLALAFLLAFFYFRKMGKNQQ